MSDPASDLGVEVLAFDVFGTVVDWRSSIIAALEDFGRRRGLSADWAGLTDDWRAAYVPNMQRVRSGALPWTNLDGLHRLALDDLLARHGLDPDEADRAWINTVWHRLDPWPDSVAGLRRLKRRFVLTPLSNGSVALLTHMAKRAGLPWDLILSAELCRHYKPDPETYRMTFELLQCRPEQVMLVAAHNDDLVHAARQGLRTAFVARPTEYGPRQVKDFAAEHPFDLVVASLEELAARLDC